MTRITSIVLVSLLLVASGACKKKEISIEGKWNINKLTTYYDDVMIAEQTNLGWIEFQSEGAGEYENGETFSWSLSDSTLRINDRDGLKSWKVTKKEKKRLVYERTYPELERTVKEKKELSKL